MPNRPTSRLLPPSPTSNPKRPTGLNLSGLPRFHPANFPSASAGASANSSISSTPSSTLSSPSVPLSPRAFHDSRRQFSDAQRHLYAHQREAVSMHRYNVSTHSPVHSPPPSSGGFRSPKPTSPRLNPLGSPGPVTPLELEQGDGYLFAAAAAASVRPGDGRELSEQAKDEIVEGYIRKETQMRPTSPLVEGRQAARAFAAMKRGDYTKHRSNLSH